MRNIFSLFLACSLGTAAFAQWKSVYPAIPEAMDVTVASPRYIFLIGESDYNKGWVLKSSDGARTWTRFELNVKPSSIFFIDSLTGFIVSAGTVHKTTDGARTWQTKVLPSGFQTPMEIHFTSAAVGYVRAADNRLAKTIDGGMTWVNLPAAPIGSSGYNGALAFADNNNGYAIADHQLYRTSNGGNSWTHIDHNYNIGLVHAVSQNIAYIASGGGFYRTLNGGQTFEPLQYMSSLRFMHFKSQDEGLLFSDYSEVYKTINGGLTIGPSYHSDFTYSWKQVSFAGDFGAAIGSGNTLLTTTDGGITWRLNQTDDQHGEFRDAHFTSPSEGFIMAKYAGVLATDDNAKSWYFDEGRLERDDISQIAFSHPDTGIFVVTNNGAYTTYDGGRSMFYNDWTVPIIGDEQSFDYEMVDSRVIYTVGQKVKVSKSVDGGKSWTPFIFGFSNSLNAIKCLDANTCHAAGAVGMVVSTWDGGANWTVHDLEVNADLRVVHLVDAQVGLIGGAQGVILRTGNGGQTWNIMHTEADFSVISFQFITPAKGFAITEGGEILRTDDAGVTWTLRQAFDLPDYTYVYKTFMRDTVHIYGLSERRLLRWTPPELSVVTSSELPGSGVTIYPNPTDRWLHFDGAETPEDIRVMDLQGRVLRTDDPHAGKIDVADLPRGILLIRITMPSGVLVKRFIKR